MGKRKNKRGGVRKIENKKKMQREKEREREYVCVSERRV